jgi:hypothetical protein
MRKHQLKLADRQCRMSELSSRVQDLVVMLTTSLYAADKPEIVRAAADVLCRDLARKLSCQRPSDRDFRAATKLGEAVEAGGFEALAGIEPAPVLMTY